MSLNKIEVKNLTVDYIEKKKRFTALKNVTFDIHDGEFVSIIGASGCGKSTLLSILEGINKPADGEVLIDGEKISGTGTNRSVVFQHYSLFPWMTTRKNVAFGIAQVKKELSKNERLKVADEFLDKVGLTEFRNKYPSQLSGGMQQRAAIARALAMDTEILLMDEPFSALDAKNRIALQELTLKLWEENRKTVVFVTHDIDEAILLSDKIVVLTSHPGTVYDIVNVPFERPREREKLMNSKDYSAFRKRLMSMFYNNIAERIGGEEVVL